VAILVAVGQGSHPANQQGALQLLASKPYGLVALWLLVIGFVCYALWQLSEAAFGVTGEDDGAVARLKAVGRAVVFAFLAYLTLKIILHTEGSQAKQQQDLTATVMAHPGGQWVVAIAGVLVAIGGLVLVGEGIRATFMKLLQTSRMSPQTRRIVKLLGQIGSIARGVVFVLVGVLVVDAAVTHKAAKSGGIDKALLTLRGEPFGPYLLVLVALGLITFGVYGLCEARWRKV
jgi:hypothetical protein